MVAAAMIIELSPETERLVQRRLESGNYPSVAVLIEHAIRALEGRDEDASSRLQLIRSRIDRGLSDVDRGDDTDGDIFMQGLIAGLGSADQTEHLPE
jgi:antitoxin ParD1/3/4